MSVKRPTIKILERSQSALPTVTKDRRIQTDLGIRCALRGAGRTSSPSHGRIEGERVFRGVCAQSTARSAQRLRWMVVPSSVVQRTANPLRRPTTSTAGLSQVELVSKGKM